jgi:hypothetical protein
VKLALIDSIQIKKLYLQKNKHMKFPKILLVFVLALSIVSCKKDDDSVEAFGFNQTNLEGSYRLNYFVSTEVETTNVNSVDIVTTTITTGDTFNLIVVFGSNGMTTANGTYRLTYMKDVAGTIVPIDPFTVDIDDEVSPYSVSSGASILTLDGSSYQVVSFNETGMTITLEEIETDSNGDTTVYNEELRFTRI